VREFQATLWVNVVNIVNVIRAKAGEPGAADERRPDCDGSPLRNNSDKCQGSWLYEPNDADVA
jgi:hypothetical protein